MILILGKGKSLLNLDNKKELVNNFRAETEQAVLLREKKIFFQNKIDQLDSKLKKIKVQLKKLKKKMKTHEEIDFEEVANLKQEQLVLKAEKKTLVKTNRREFRKIKKEAKTQIKILNHKNFFFKDLYMNLIKFTYRRFLTIGLFYILTAIALSVTLAPMFGMGLIILIGILIGFMVTLFVVIPL
jgi:DNA gyrase/topoisomerase IV subunit A